MSKLPKSEREAAKEKASRMLDRIRATAGVDTQELADACGVDEGRVRQWQSPRHGAQMGLADLAYMAPPAVARPLLDHMADEMGCALVELPVLDASCASDLHLAANAQREHGEAVGALLDAVADGHITRAEGARLEREVDQAIACLLAIRERARAAQREGVVGTTGLKAVGS